MAHQRPVGLKDIFRYVHLATSVECAWVEQWLNNNPDIDLNAYQNEDGWTLLSLRTLAARGRAKPTGLLKSVCDLPDGVVFKCLEYKFGTAGVRVPRIEDIDRAQKESGIMEAIQALAETLQISNGEAIELIMREEANVPDYA